jgi:hypothetical protein
MNNIGLDRDVRPHGTPGVKITSDNVEGKIIVITGASSFAIGQPEDADINEILFRPTRQEI